MVVIQVLVIFDANNPNMSYSRRWLAETQIISDAVNPKISNMAISQAPGGLQTWFLMH